MHPSLAIALVMLGCCSNVIFLEHLVSVHPGSGNIITFMQFLFIATEGFIFTLDFGRKPNVIPLRIYGLMVSFFFVVQVINNYAFNYRVPMTLHIIFRAGSLIASLTLGVVLMKKSYPLEKYLSVFLVTAGICMCTWASATYDGKKSSEECSDGELDLWTWSIGIGMLVVSLFLTARMGLFQEQIYKSHGKYPDEALFFNHALPLPGFLLVAPDIYRHAIEFNNSAPVDILYTGIEIPEMWLYLAANVITQYICIQSVFVLTTECSALTVTLVVTLRKFLSLLLSIWYFNNSFTLLHWLGAALVFIGTLMFTDIIPLRRKPKAKAQ